MQFTTTVSEVHGEFKRDYTLSRCVLSKDTHLLAFSIPLPERPTYLNLLALKPVRQISIWLRMESEPETSSGVWTEDLTLESGEGNGHHESRVSEGTASVRSGSEKSYSIVQPRSPKLRSKPAPNCLSMEEYKDREFSLWKPHCTLDVVMADSVSVEPGTGKIMLPQQEGADMPATRKENHELVRFIQINSGALCKLTGNGDYGQDQVVILAPFKSLCYKERKLRAQLAALTSKWDNVTWESIKASRGCERQTDMELTSGSDRESSYGHADLRFGEKRVQPGHGETEACDASWKDTLKPQSTTPLEALEEHVKTEAKCQAQPTLNVAGKDAIHPSRLSGPLTAANLHNAPVSKASQRFTEHEKSTTAGSCVTTEQAGKDEHDESGGIWDPIHEDDLKEDSLKAYEDLKCLLEFYDYFVKPRWHYLRSERVRRVRYGDLCFVFQPGDVVVMPEGSQKCRRVLKISGGRPMRGHLHKGDFNGAREK